MADALGRSITLTYGGSNHIASLSDFTGRTWTYGYDGAGHLTSSTTPSDATTPAATTQYTYFSVSYNAHRMKSVIDPRGQMTSFDYYANGKTFRTSEPEGKVTTYVYQPLKNETLIVDDRGSSWHKRYDDRGRVVEMIDPEGNASQFTWDAAGNRTSWTNELGQTFLYAYDSRGNLTATTDPLGAPSTYEYGSTWNRATAATDPRTKRTEFTIDGANGNLSSVKDALNRVTSFTYNAYSQVASVTDAKNKTTRYRYDASFNLREVEDPLGHVTTFAHDALGRRTSVADHLGNTRGWAYDLLGRVTREVDELGNETRFQYDLAGNLTRITDAENRVVQIAYDGLGHPIQVTAHSGAVTRYEYTNAGCGCSSEKLSAVIDALGRRTRFEYDSRGWLTAETDPLGRSTTYEYDAARNTKRKTHADGTWVSYGHDAANRMVQKAYSDGTTFSFAYDPAGNTLSAAAPGITLSFTYDDLGRMATVTDSRLGGKTISYQYDLVGLRLTMQDPQGGLSQYVRDDARRLTSVTHPGGAAVGFTWDAANRLAQVSYPNGTTATLGTNAASRPVSIDHRNSGGTVFASMAYGFDRTGQVNSLTDGDGLHSYTYDAARRLVRATHPASPTESFQYDAVGNRIANSTGAAHAVDVGDQLLRIGQVERTYDLRGNLIRERGESGAITSYGYDAENQLIRVDRPDGSIVRYAYDAYGRRIERDVGGAKTLYLYDGPNVLLEYDATGVVKARYGFGEGADLPWTVTAAGSTYALHHDRQRSLVAVTNAAQTVVGRISYDAFGNVLSESGVSMTRFRYSGRELDRETGLYHHRSRYYDPRAGRFTTRDPLGTADGTNQHSYVLGNPTTYVDPQGSIAFIPILVAAWGIFEIASSAYDIYSTGQLWFDCKAGTGEKVLATGLTVLGLIGPGGGYGKGGTVVYHAVEDGATRYVGISDDLARRAAEHLRQKGISIDAIPGLGNLSRADARAVEQALINHHGLERNGGSLMNKINSIAESNPIYGDALRRGQEILRQAGYPGF